jgi:exportin-1
MYSEMIGAAIAEGGPHAARSSFVKYMRAVKKAVLRLVDVFVDRCEDDELLATRFVPALLDPILGDYARNVPDARDAEVLGVFATVVNKLKGRAEPHVPAVLERTFEPTLSMITRNFEDYPEHRLRFFALLHAVTNHCFGCLFLMSPAQLKLVIDSIVWAVRHTERNVADTGLSLLLDMLSSFAGSEYATQFHQVCMWVWVCVGGVFDDACLGSVVCV